MPIRLTTLAIARCIVLKEMADSNLYPDIREQKNPLSQVCESGYKSPFESAINHENRWLYFQIQQG